MVNSTVHLIDEIKRGTTAAKCAPVLGVVWAACNALKSITLDNKARALSVPIPMLIKFQRAVLRDVEQVTCTMKDAVRELNETVEATKPSKKEDEDDFGSADLDGLSPATRALAVPVLQLMKTGCSLATGLEKLFAPLGQGPEDIECMESALTCVRALGKEIDEVACAIYECDEDDDGLKGVVTLATAFHGTCAKLVALLLGNPILKGQPEALKRLEVTNGVLNQALAQCRIQP